MTEQELGNSIRRKAIQFQIGGFRPEDSTSASWFGKVLLGKPDEKWPESNGSPMIPICQINLTEISELPEQLSDLQLITLFIDSEELPDDSPNGEGWLIRTYDNLSELVHLENPEYSSPIKPYQMKTLEPQDDYPFLEDLPVDLPEEFEEDYHTLFPNVEGVKLGG